jgi:hypothetical protein
VSPSKKADRQKDKAANTEATPIQDHKKSGVGVVVLRVLSQRGEIDDQLQQDRFISG